MTEYTINLRFMNYSLELYTNILIVFFFAFFFAFFFVLMYFFGEPPLYTYKSYSKAILTNTKEILNEVKETNFLIKKHFND